VFMFLALCPSSTQTISNLISDKFKRSPVTIPYEVTRIPPSFLRSLICFSLFWRPLSSNYMTF
jgi:hypothetical protein